MEKHLKKQPDERDTQVGDVGREMPGRRRQKEDERSPFNGVERIEEMEAKKRSRREGCRRGMPTKKRDAEERESRKEKDTGGEGE